MMLTCSKKYRDFPFAHRQPNHAGHCKYIHGHNWGFDFTFQCEKVDACGFVIDFGSLGWLKAMLDDMFDHTLVLNIDDPYLDELKDMLGNTTDPKFTISTHPQFAQIKAIPNCGCEGIAEFLFEEVDRILRARSKSPEFPTGRVFLKQVVVHEDDRNSATRRLDYCGHA